jgi:predicted O-linked N-acetylglucosamine transferase (SPINDLY family)
MLRWFFRSNKAASTSSAADPARERDAKAGDPVALVLTALQHHQAGRLREAEARYREVLRIDPENIDALHFLGVTAYQQGRHEEAGRLISQSLSREANNAPAHNNLGNVLVAQGRLEEAIESFEQAIALKADYVDAYTNLAAVRVRRNELDQAVACYERALSIAPDSPRLHFNLANLLPRQGRLEEAIESYRRAVALKPDFPEAYSNLGNALRQIGRPEEAVACCKQALALKSDFADALCNLGIALKDLDRLEEAINSCREALALEPGSVEGHYILGDILVNAGRHDEAMECFRKALALNPEYADARWALAMSQLPAVYEADSHPERSRAAFSRELEELERWFEPARTAAGFNAVGVQQPFYLAYQEENNRALLGRYGNLCSRIMEEWFRGQGFAAPKRLRGEAIRVGIVSHQFRDHSVWSAIVKGWFQHLDPRRFALEAFYLGSDHDQETRYAQSRTSHFEEGAGGLRQWVEAVLGRQPDVLIYPEIGMFPMTLRLASLRLAPVQIATWGHPETTGLPTIDYYLSAEDLEPVDAQENYTERLVRLPHLGCFYRPTEFVPADPDWPGLGMDRAVPVLLCPGVPYKYAPRYDSLFAEIALALGRCRFVFFHFRSGYMSARLRGRLETVFARSKLDFDDYAVFVPWQSRPAFRGLLERADVFLDTIGFSGFNTAMQAVECGLPIVTREGRFLRGNLASGILKRIGLQELVTRSEEEYVALAVRLCRDGEYRESLRRRIAAGRHVLFEDVAPIRAMEGFLSEAAGR